MVARTDVFEAAVAPLLPRARAVARRLVADPSLAEDAVQEALLRAYRFWHRRRASAAWPWLRQVVVRECWRLLRQRSAQGAGPIADDVQAATPPLDERAILAEEYLEARRAVDRMPAGYRSVLRLRHGHALGETAVAAILGLPLGTVQWRLKRAHDHLRLVLTGRRARPLAATLREVTRSVKIRVLTERRGPLVPPPPGVEWSGFIRYEPATEEQARAAIPAFRMPPEVPAAYPNLTILVGRRGPDASRGAGEPELISVRTPGPRLVIECTAPEYVAHDQPEHTPCFPGAEIGVDEDTHVGDRYGHWTEVNGRHNLWWFSGTGAMWRVSGEVHPAEVRRIAEAIEAQGATGPE